MKDVKYHLYFSYQEQSQLLKALINLKNELIAQGTKKFNNNPEKT